MRQLSVWENPIDQPTAERQNSNARCHLALNVHRDLQDKLFDALHCTSFDNGEFVLF